MKRSGWIVGLTLLGLCPLALAGQGPSPKEISIRGMFYSGTGCPNGTVHGRLSEDGNWLIARFDKFLANDGPSQDRAERRKSCTLTMDLAVPAGYAYSIFELDTLGHLKLDRGTSAEQKVTVRFAGDDLGNSVSFPHRYEGPRAGTFHTADKVRVESAVWSGCGGGKPLNVTTALVASAEGRSEALIGVDFQLGRMEHRLALMWKRCDESGAVILPTPDQVQCTDIAPDDHYPCSQQASWGKCQEPWMQGYCDRTCARCDSGCVDIAPDDRYTCAQQASWGKCQEPWMQGYCALSCGGCGPSVGQN